jgi:O-antigen ligase
LSSLLALPSEIKRRAKYTLALCAAIALFPLMQLVPLPPSVWTSLPHREEIVEIFKSLGGELPWLPLSVAPDATWLGALSLLPPLAIFLGIVQLSYRERRLISVVVLGMGILAAAIGLIQVAQGPSSPLRFFAITSDVEAVGFFANTNHFAALMYSLVPFGAAWATDQGFTIGMWRARKDVETRSIAMLMAIFLALIVFIAADILTRSRAGLALIILAAFGALALPIADRRRPSRLTPIKLVIGSGSVILLLIVQFGLYRVYEKFAVDPIHDVRLVFARNTIAAAKAYMPFGSGVGSFVPVYPTFEAPQDTIANVYANHAHNDWLEIWLEGGVFSMILVGAFVIWFAFAAVRIWRGSAAPLRAIDILLARAATIPVPLIMAHSIVDYPLRTGGMMALVAFCCAFMVEPLVPANDQRPRLTPVEHSQEDDLPVSLPPAQLPAIAKAPDAAPAKSAAGASERWGEDIEWPQEWRR